MAEIVKPDMRFLWASGGAVVAPSSNKINEGWTAEVPPHQWENFVQLRQDEAIAYLFQRGIAEWDKTTEYFADKSVVLYNGILYIAIVNNQNTLPTNTTRWKPITRNATTSTAGLMSPADKLKIDGIEAGAQKNVVLSVAGKVGAVSLTKSDVGLSNVDNTSDAQKPISTATQNALNSKANTHNPTFTGTVSGIAKGMVGLGNVDNTSDLDKPISTATQAAIDEVVSRVEEASFAEIQYNYLTGVTTNTGSGPNLAHINMRRCLVLDDGTVNYYLDEFDSNLKEDGTPADLSGADGQVMVEIPRFWCSVQTTGVLLKIKVSPTPLLGLELHPAFKSGDTEHSYIYVGAYNATVLDTELNSIIAGLNLDNNTSRVDLTVDKLCSLSGGDNYAMVGLNLAEFRSLAQNRGEGWQVWDYNTWQAIQILGYTELGTFNGQAALGNGNVSKSYPASSENQEDSPHTLNGASNHLGNGSGATNDFMTYRGIENLWGQCWQWTDGVLFNDYQTYVCDTPETYSSTLTSDYKPVGESYEDHPSGTYITEFQAIPDSVLLIPKTGSGNSGQFVGDGFWNNTGLRGAGVGGRAAVGARCGFSALAASSAPSYRDRARGCRIQYKNEYK